MRWRSIIVAALLLSSCRNQPDPVELPQGTQELTGILQRVELSLVRRGTHVLVQNGEETTYVESKVVQLRKYEREEVTLRGRFEQNTDPSFLPVFMVRSVKCENCRDATEGSEEERSVSPTDETGSLIKPKSTGVPCGGPAGVLCPDGHYCIIEDFEDGVGKCAKLNSPPS